MKVLVGRDDISLDKQDNAGRTPLSWAAILWQEVVVKILPGRDGVSPDKPDKSGRTPFWYDSQYGKAGAIVLLQSRASATTCTT